jgi:peptidoglycan/LPS O-acetylase OafA/YrhL
MRPTIPYRHEIDGLRAIAVLAVILNHAGFKAVSGGFIGVDVFFVISGFLITQIVLKDLRSGRFSLPAFYERRARRILPALVAMVLAVTPVAVIWMAPWELAAYGKSIMAAALSVSNIAFWQEAGYFAAASQTKPLLHTWSLGVEEQFYILLPLALMPLVRRDRLLLALVIAATVLSFGLSEIGWRWKPDANFYLLPTRAWELLVGVLCALIAARAAPRPNDLLAGAGVALVIGAIFVFDEITPAPSLCMLAPVGGAALVLMFTRPGCAVARALSWRPVALIGLISYSAYLWHQPIFALARIRLGAPPSDALMVTLSAAALAVGWLSWRFVERPFRRSAPGRPLAARRAALRCAGAAIAGMALAGAVGWVSGGLLALKADPMQRAYLRSAAPSPLRAACHTGGAAYLPPARACTLPEGAATWAVLGDSHAVELAYALAQEPTPQGQAVRQLSFSGCAPSWNTGGATPCARWTDQAVQNLIDDDRIEVVAVSYRLTTHLAQTPDPVWRAYVDMIAALRAAGKTVAVVLQAPELPAPMRDLAMRGGGARIQGLDLAQWEARRATVSARMQDLPPNAAIIDPAEVFCASAGCLAGRDGVSNYFDDNHMSVAGAARVARLLIARAFAKRQDASGPSAAARDDLQPPRLKRWVRSAL